MSQETLDKIKEWIKTNSWLPEDSWVITVSSSELEDYLQTLVINQ